MPTASKTRLAQNCNLHSRMLAKTAVHVIRPLQPAGGKLKKKMGFAQINIRKKEMHYD